MRISDGSSDVCSSDLSGSGASGGAWCWLAPVGGGHDRKQDVRFRYASRNHGARCDRCRIGGHHCRWGHGEHDQCALCIAKRSEERREGKSVSVRVDLGGRRIIKKKNPENKVETLPTQSIAENRLE